MSSPAVELALRLAADGRADHAVRTLSAAGDKGDAAALYQLAIWNLVGVEVPRNLPAARAWLRCAVEIGHVDAALMEVALIANGSGAPPDWPRALALLRTAAQNDPLASAHLALVDAMALDQAGGPAAIPASERLSDSPNVVRFSALLTPAECQHIAEIAHGSLEPAVVVDPQTGEMITHPVRTSRGTMIGPTKESLVVRAINQRIAAASGTSTLQGEPLAVLHYAAGQEYRPHFDGIDGAANQRIKTALVYLNQGYLGGETQFMANGLKIAGRSGDVVIFSNALPDGTLDRAAEHAGLPVLAGQKWLATRWIRAAPHDPWNPR